MLFYIISMNREQVYLEDFQQYLLIIFGNFYLIENLNQKWKKAK